MHVESWIDLLTGAVLMGASALLALRARETGAIIRNYYANMKKRGERLPGVLAAQFVPGVTVSILMALVLAFAGFALGCYFVVSSGSF
jgi:hypothetical protein